MSGAPQLPGTAAGHRPDQTEHHGTQVDYAPTAYDGSPYVEVNNNIPDFPASDYTTTSFERYGKLDKLGRCTTAYANIGRDLMPTEKRGDISQIKPSGWHSVRYDCVEGKSLYNRCHLIGYQLTGGERQRAEPHHRHPLPEHRGDAPL